MTSNKNVLFFVYFIILFIIGSFGFYLIGGREWSLVDSIYMTVITLSTVGFTEVHPLGDTGRIWAMIIIIFGVIGVGILFSSLRDAFMHLNTFRRIKMMKKINKLQGHFIIVGYGRMQRNCPKKDKFLSLLKKMIGNPKKLLKTECIASMVMQPWTKH